MGNVKTFESVCLPEQFREELWQIIALDLQLRDLRSLYLTCKTLFWIFTNEEGKWFANHPVYIVFSEWAWYSNHQFYATSSPRFEISEVPWPLYLFRDRVAKRFEINCRALGIDRHCMYGQGMFENTGVVAAINSYETVRIFFNILSQTVDNQSRYRILLETKNIEEEFYRLAVEEEAKCIQDTLTAGRCFVEKNSEMALKFTKSVVDQMNKNKSYVDGIYGPSWYFTSGHTAVLAPGYWPRYSPDYWIRYSYQISEGPN